MASIAFSAPSTREQASVLTLVLVAMALIIGSVWLFEWWGYAPCQLCLEQRKPYYWAMPIVALAIPAAFAGWPQCVARGALAIATLALVATALIGAYHAGVEWGWFAAPASCGAGISGAGSDAGSLLADLAGSVPPKCDEAAGRFLGLSFAGWNVIVASALAVFAGRAAAR